MRLLLPNPFKQIAPIKIRLATAGGNQKNCSIRFTPTVPLAYGQTKLFPANKSRAVFLFKKLKAAMRRVLRLGDNVFRSRKVAPNRVAMMTPHIQATTAAQLHNYAHSTRKGLEMNVMVEG